jgi:uncharacterized protein (DUF2267 family)
VAHDTSHLATAAEFYQRVVNLLHRPSSEVHPLIVTVFEAIRPELSERVTDQVASRLSPELKALWLGNM